MRTEAASSNSSSAVKRRRMDGMQVHTFLTQGDGTELAALLPTELSDTSALSVLVVFSLGADHSKIQAAIAELQLPETLPVYMTETYGILGFDLKEGRNLEFMEKGRGSEYGCRGGDGGQGSVVVAFFGSGIHASHGLVPEGATSCMVVTTGSGWAQASSGAPVHYGGVTKECFLLRNQAFESVPFFCVSTRDNPVGIAAVQSDVGTATRDLLSQLPPGREASGAVALFPCFTRGVNEYDKNDVEPEAVSQALPGCRIFGMFAHGELGPASFSGFCPPAQSEQTCVQHSMTTVMAVYTSE